MEQHAAQRLRMMRLGGWSAAVSGTIAAVGLVLRFARFAFPGGLVGWFNDLLVMIQLALALPIAVALHVVFSRHHPGVSRLALIVGIAGMLAVVVLQALLLVRALTLTQQVVPMSIAILVVGEWLIITSYRGRSTGLLRHSLPISLLAVPYFGYPIWAWWLARGLLSGRVARASGAVMFAPWASAPRPRLDVHGLPQLPETVLESVGIRALAQLVGPMAAHGAKQGCIHRRRISVVPCAT